MYMEWKEKKELNKTGLILALCQDNTGIYNQLMTVFVKNDNRTFYENSTLGSSARVYPDKIKAGIYLDEICSEKIIKKFCKEA